MTDTHRDEFFNMFEFHVCTVAYQLADLCRFNIVVGPLFLLTGSENLWWMTLLMILLLLRTILVYFENTTHTYTVVTKNGQYCTTNTSEFLLCKVLEAGIKPAEIIKWSSRKTIIPQTIYDIPSSQMVVCLEHYCYIIGYTARLIHNLIRFTHKYTIIPIMYPIRAVIVSYWVHKVIQKLPIYIRN